MWVGDPGGTLTRGGPVTVALSGPVYVGLAVCSHDAGVLETAVFSNVRIEEPPQPILRSKISIYDLAAKKVEVVYTADQRIEAPNWSPDGSYLLVNSLGDLWKLPLSAKPAALERINLNMAIRCNNDHGITPDGKLLILSGSTTTSSQIFTASMDGSNVKLLTPKAPSYYHGVSPDGKWLVYTAQRDGDYDLHRVPTSGGEEERLNRADGLDDGPDYSPDGKWIYLNSIRTGNFDIWRIPAEGAGEDDANAQQITNDEWEDWFPHPSPDGKWIVLLSYAKGTEGHPQNRNVRLRLMPLPGDTLSTPRPVPETIVELFGGQGTINVNSWSPDSARFAFVSYELVTSAGD
jgi:Tol biopolymer transport system component